MVPGLTVRRRSRTVSIFGAMGRGFSGRPISSRENFSPRRISKGVGGIGFGTAESVGGQPGNFEDAGHQGGGIEKEEAAAAPGDGFEGLKEEEDAERGDEARLGEAD
jgi:hypothetical protein